MLLLAQSFDILSSRVVDVVATVIVVLAIGFSIWWEKH